MISFSDVIIIEISSLEENNQFFMSEPPPK